MNNILFGLMILGVTLSCMIDNGKLSGVVTYEGLISSVNQADAGSEIYVINEADIKTTQFDDIERVMENFQFIKSNYFHILVWIFKQTRLISVLV